jgi:peptide chain release factor 1
MLEKLKAIKEKFIYLEEQMSNPDVNNDQVRARKVYKEHKELKPLIEAFDRQQAYEGALQSAKDLLLVEKDEEMRAFAKEEIEDLKSKLEGVAEEIRLQLIPKDPDDEKDVIFEIRSGAGGDEAAIFAGDLYRMYMRYFSDQKWSYEVIDETPGDAGGYSKIILEVTGENVYGMLKFESGAHRVQRVPETEAKGRLHTSAATVVVMPRFEPEDIDIKKDDLRVDTFRASGAGGQHVNKTESGIRFTHLPTGIVSESTESRSQHKNRDIAFGRLAQRIRDAQMEAHNSSVTSARRSLVGSGDRSEKIRTYNWPQNRVTDHRLEGDNKNFNLDKVIVGDISGLVEALQIAESAEKMKSSEVE